MSKLSYTAKLKLSITMDEFLIYATPLVDKRVLKEAIMYELMQCAEGMINGDFGGSYIDDWHTVFFRQLKTHGVIEFTQQGIDTFT